MNYHTSMKSEDMSFCGSGVVGTKGQVVVPKDLRDSQSISEGDQLIFMDTPQEGVFVVMKAERLNVVTQHLEDKLKKLSSIKSKAGK